MTGNTFIGGITISSDDFVCEVCGHKYRADFICIHGMPDYESVRCPKCQIPGRGKSRHEKEQDEMFEDMFERAKPTIQKLKERNK